jgi:hypothetical protein
MPEALASPLASRTGPDVPSGVHDLERPLVIRRWYGLMLCYDHRFSKVIDSYVPDPQYLGHVNPWLGGPAEALTSEYDVNAEFIKLYLPQGEIDVVVGAALTGESFVVEFHGRPVRVETCVDGLCDPGPALRARAACGCSPTTLESNTAVFALAKEMSSLVGLTRAERMSR